MNKPSKLTTAVAFLLFVVLMAGGFIWCTYFPAAPYVTFGVFLLIALGGYTGKRLLTKTEKFGGLYERLSKAVGAGNSDRVDSDIPDPSAGQQKD